MTSWLNNVDDAQLRESVEQLISAYPDSLQVVQRLINHYNDKLARIDQEREHKKRKIDPSPSTDIIATIVDISFQLPARKKYNFILTSEHLILVNPKTDQVEHTFDLSKVQIGVCVPSPAPTKGHTFALFFSQVDTDPICFSIQQKQEIVIKRSNDQQVVSDDGKHVAITQLLVDQGVKMTQPSKPYFNSTLINVTTGKRSDEDRFYANAYLKAKEGSLYFLPEGILYGFKKPVSFYPLSCLASTFYSNITQHTFNLSLVLHKSHRPLGSAFISAKDDDEAAVEFSMIEQSEFGGIDGYIKKVGINDKSMSEENMAPETKARIIQQDEEPNHHDDEDEESDHDFQPSDGDVDPLEYDSEAGSSDEDDHVMEDHDPSDINQESEDERRLTSSEQDPVVVSDDAAEQDITRTDNESDEEEELQATEDDVEEEEEVVEEEEEEEQEGVEEDEDEEEDDSRSESLGSSSEDDIDEDMHEAVIPDDAKDELEDSD